MVKTNFLIGGKLSERRKQVGHKVIIELSHYGLSVLSTKKCILQIPDSIRHKVASC